MPILPQRGIRHPKSGPHVLRNQFDRSAIGHWIGLGQILHRFHQQALALDVSRIGTALPPLASHFWRNRNRENFSHEDQSWALDCPEGWALGIKCLSSINRRALFFSLYLEPVKPRFRGLHPGSILRLGPILSLWRNNLRLFCRLQLEHRVGNLLIGLDIRILRQAVVPGRLKQLLLH
jgi:hypothetical protein